ncbi:MAG: STAS domain-containing protein [Proteobacteria bacterium]|nr:STAS domain-containing protein [Pseudomonadota bacterium]
MKIAVPDYPTLSDLRALQAQFASSRRRDLEIDLTEVHRLGALLLQLLHCAAETWRADGTKLTITGMTESFSKTLDLVGYDKKSLQANIG